MFTVAVTEMVFWVHGSEGWQVQEPTVLGPHEGVHAASKHSGELYCAVQLSRCTGSDFSSSSWKATDATLESPPRGIF